MQKNHQTDHLDAAEFILQARLKAGLTQATLGDALGVSSNTARALEAEGRIPRPETARKLARIFGLPLPELARVYGWLADEDLEILRQAWDGGARVS